MVIDWKKLIQMHIDAILKQRIKMKGMNEQKLNFEADKKLSEVLRLYESRKNLKEKVDQMDEFLMGLTTMQTQPKSWTMVDIIHNGLGVSVAVPVPVAKRFVYDVQNNYIIELSEITKQLEKLLC